MISKIDENIDSAFDWERFDKITVDLVLALHINKPLKLVDSLDEIDNLIKDSLKKIKEIIKANE